MAVFVAFAAEEVGAQSAAAPPGASRGAELQRIRLAIERLEEKLGSIAVQRGDRRQKLEALGLEVDLQEQRVAEAGAERRLVEQRLDELAADIEGLERLLADSRRRLRRGLATLYRVGGGTLWRSLLGATTPSGSLTARRMLRYLSWRQAERLNDFRRDRDRLADRRSESLAARRRAAELLERETDRLRRLAELREEQSQALAALEREEAELARRAAELAERQGRLTELLSYLAGRRPEATDDKPIQRFKGLLDWPIAGRVVEGFGPRLDPRYKTRVPHNGISVEADDEGVVRAIYPGVVVFAEDFEGFGITVVVHHTGRVFTLYSGLSAARVTAEDVVSSGQVLGRAAGRLYFEVRVEDRPEDPLEWLR